KLHRTDFHAAVCGSVRMYPGGGHLGVAVGTVSEPDPRIGPVACHPLFVAGRLRGHLYLSGYDRKMGYFRNLANLCRLVRYRLTVYSVAGAVDTRQIAGRNRTYTYKTIMNMNLQDAYVPDTGSSAENVAFYRDLGYLVAPSLFSNEEIDELRQEASRIFRGQRG